jgi:hypothetical protein
VRRCHLSGRVSTSPDWDLPNGGRPDLVDDYLSFLVASVTRRLIDPLLFPYPESSPIRGELIRLSRLSERASGTCLLPPNEFVKYVLSCLVIQVSEFAELTHDRDGLEVDRVINSRFHRLARGEAAYLVIRTLQIDRRFRFLHRVSQVVHQMTLPTFGSFALLSSGLFKLSLNLIDCREVNLDINIAKTRNHLSAIAHQLVDLVNVSLINETRNLVLLQQTLELFFCSTRIDLLASFVDGIADLVRAGSHGFTNIVDSILE